MPATKPVLTPTRYSANELAATRTISSVITAIATSPTTPTASGRQPCFISSPMFVRSPTPAKVNKKAQRDRFARSATCAYVKLPAVASADTTTNPSTNFGNFCHRKVALLPI